jgi:uncharacterized protein (DUF169 family)
VDARTAGRRLTELLSLASRPVAVTFTATAPAGVPRVAKAGPAGCAYWKQAAEGAVFYTEAADHYNCPGAATMGRPACAMIPAVLGGPTGVTSLGCIGNRVYTGLGDDEFYFTIPGPRIGDVVERLETVVRANRELETYHEGRRASL